MPSLNEILHELVDAVHGKSTQAADALRAKIDAAVPAPEAEKEDENAAE